MHITTRKLLPLPIAFLACVPVASCISTTSGVGSASQGCPEFQVGSSFENLNVDARVRAFMQASADLGNVAATLKPAVKTACIGMATDLGVQDTWSALGDSDDAISNGNGTGACDAVRARIVDIMTLNVNANFALVVTRGECHPDFTAEANCEAGCNTQTKCDPGTVETRCDPAQLSVVCQGNCGAQAFCEGTTETSCNCEGSCEAECTGHCTGTCTDESGHKTTDDPNCHGKCSDHCSGTCSGRCKIDVSTGVACGANVYCKAGCMTSYTSPRCETEFTPPSCTIDTSCFETCRASVVAKSVCEPTTVKLLADVTVSADVATLVTTINKNLPPLMQTAEAEGRIAADVVPNVLSTGQVVANASGSLDGKSLACATAAGKSLADTASSLTVSVQAGAQVTTDTSSHAQ